MSKEISFKVPIALQDSAPKISVNHIQLSADDQGYWTIGWNFRLDETQRVLPTGMTLNEHHAIGGQVIVTRAEIGAAAGLSEAQVRTHLTLAQTEGLVTQIALSKILPVFNTNLANIQM